MIGNFRFEVVATGRQAKLDMALTGRAYVRKGPEFDPTTPEDDERIESFGKRYGNVIVANNDDDDIDGSAML